jgi:hypothetical protein
MERTLTINEPYGVVKIPIHSLEVESVTALEQNARNSSEIITWQPSQAEIQLAKMQSFQSRDTHTSLNQIFV